MNKTWQQWTALGGFGVFMLGTQGMVMAPAGSLLFWVSLAVQAIGVLISCGIIIKYPNARH